MTRDEINSECERLNIGRTERKELARLHRQIGGRYDNPEITADLSICNVLELRGLIGMAAIEGGIQISLSKSGARLARAIARLPEHS